MKTAYLFSGQGAQYEGMARDLYANSPVIKDFYDEANDTLGFNLLELSAEDLADTKYAQLATLCHSLALWIALDLDVNDGVHLAGFSLGEYSSYGAAKLLDYTELLKLVQKRAEFMAEDSTKNPAAMFAVLNLDDEIIEKHLADNYAGKVYPVNYNSPGQLVISGLENETIQVADELVELGARRAVRLNTSGAFHTPFMHEASLKLADYAKDFKWNTTETHLYSNYSGEKFTETDLANMPEYLSKHMVSPVRWKETVINMYDEGVRRFIELGPGKTLSGLVKRTLRQNKDTEIINIDSFADLENYLS